MRVQFYTYRIPSTVLQSERKTGDQTPMAKEDADASVTLIYAGKYQFQQKQRADSDGDTLYGPAFYFTRETTSCSRTGWIRILYPAAGHDVISARTASFQYDFRGIFAFFPDAVHQPQ